MGLLRCPLFCCWCLLMMTSAALGLGHEFADEDDAVVVEADPSERSKRQLLLRSPMIAYQYDPFAIPAVIPTQDWSATPIMTSPCFTSKELNNWDSWIIGMYDTCSYFTAQGRQMFGVCCATNLVRPDGTTTTTTTTTTETPIEELDDPTSPPATTAQGPNATDNTKSPYYPQFPNWPPPFITHPPEHNTHPPLPTHPPSPGFPFPSPAPTMPSVPTQTTTKSPAPPAWPPALPTQPTARPTQRPTTRPPQTVKPPPPATDGSCGAKNGYQDQERIVGGHNADVGEWPWIAALFNGGRQFCGGSLIDSSHILTAAHCVAHMSSWDVARLTVRLGDHNIKTNTEIQHVEKKVRRVVRHRGFDSRTLYNDIAILTLDNPITFTNQIRSICLPSGSSDYAGQTATVIGWGSLRESGPQPAVLQEVNIPIWTNSDCRLKYGPAAPGGIVEHMLCAGQASRDSCSGDSGGPLMINAGRWTQVGIVSWGIGCGKGQYPGVYTRVEKFLPWIYKNLK